jgi:signal transduction histidine kinase/CheY-like chemotaxis protein
VVSPILAALPLAAYAVVLFFSLQTERIGDLRTDIQRATSGLAAAVNIEIAASTRALEALATSGRLEVGDVQGFREEARRLLSVQPNWHNVVLLDASRQVVNLRYPADAASLPSAAEVPVASVLQTGRPSNAVLSDGSVAIRVPVRLQRGVRYALVAVLPGTAIATSVTRLRLPPGWTVLMVDEDGRQLVRGGSEPATPPSLRALAAQPGQPTWIEDGRLAVAQLVGDTRWTMLTAAPPANLITAAWSWLLAALGLSAAFAGLSIAARIALRNRRAEQERARKAAEDHARLEEQERRRTDLLATVSHELRTPLTGLLGYTELLGRASLSAEARGWVEQQARAGQALLALIGDVLDYARLKEGAVQLEDTDIDLPALLEDCAGVVRSLAAQKGLLLMVEPDAGLPRWIRGDPLRLRQVITNLLGNAIKFTRAGRVTLCARLAPASHEIEIAVVDTGPGIPPEALPRIFDRFRQAGADTARRFGGSGLGLAISRRLVTAMGGVISAESTLGQGSRFSFRIPFRPGSAPPARAVAKLRILVAEDVAASRLLLTSVLQRAGHEVTGTEDGARALAAMHGQSFDMLLVDLNMPGMDGFGVAAAVRAMPGEASRVPMLALTADAPEEVEPRCREAGFDGVLRKPYETRRLLALMDALRSRPEPVGREGLRAAVG